MSRAFTVLEIMTVIAIIAVVAAIAIPNLSESRKRSRKIESTPITYAMKNTLTYLVRAQCSNCKKFHRIETSVGVKVKYDHLCPWCGIKGEFTVLADE